MSTVERDGDITREPKKRNNKPIIIGGVIVVTILALIAIVPMVMALMSTPGIKTEPIETTGAKPASTEMDGTWTVLNRQGKNHTSAGFTFDELLPGDARNTSGSTTNVSGEMVIESGTLTSGEVTVDLTNIVTDRDVRDVNVRRKILSTDTYPEAYFTLTKPADVSSLPEDGTAGTVELTGDLTIRGVTNEITQEFTVLRTGDHVIVHADIPFNRLDYGVETPDFIAAKIAEEGQINIRLNLVKKD